MKRKRLYFPKNSSEINHYAKIIGGGRYFRKVSNSHIKEILRHSELITLNADEYLIHKDQSNSPELIVLLEGSLAVRSKSQFVMRLSSPGYLVG